MLGGERSARFTRQKRNPTPPLLSGRSIREGGGRDGFTSKKKSYRRDWRGFDLRRCYRGRGRKKASPFKKEKKGKRDDLREQKIEMRTLPVLKSTWLRVVETISVGKENSLNFSALGSAARTGEVARGKLVRKGGKEGGYFQRDAAPHARKHGHEKGTGGGYDQRPKERKNWEIGCKKQRMKKALIPLHLSSRRMRVLTN